MSGVALVVLGGAMIEKANVCRGERANVQLSIIGTVLCCFLYYSLLCAIFNVLKMATRSPGANSPDGVQHNSIDSKSFGSRRRQYERPSPVQSSSMLSRHIFLGLSVIRTFRRTILYRCPFKSSGLLLIMMMMMMMMMMCNDLLCT